MSLGAVGNWLGLSNQKTQPSSVYRDAAIFGAGAVATVAVQKAYPYVKPYAVQAGGKISAGAQATKDKVTSLFSGSNKAAEQKSAAAPAPGRWYFLWLA